MCAIIALFLYKKLGVIVIQEFVVVVATLGIKREVIIQRHYAVVIAAAALDALSGMVRMVGMVARQHRQRRHKRGRYIDNRQDCCIYHPQSSHHTLCITVAAKIVKNLVIINCNDIFLYFFDKGQGVA